MEPTLNSLILALILKQDTVPQDTAADAEFLAGAIMRELIQYVKGPGMTELIYEPVVLQNRVKAILEDIRFNSQLEDVSDNEWEDFLMTQSRTMNSSTRSPKRKHRRRNNPDSKRRTVKRMKPDL